MQRISVGNSTGVPNQPRLDWFAALMGQVRQRQGQRELHRQNQQELYFIRADLGRRLQSLEQ